MMGGLNDGSASRRSISVARLKKLSARRKKPVRGRLEPRARRMQRWSDDSERLVANAKLIVPPSALNPDATASASRMVDFPAPFSPMKYVTAESGNNSSACSAGSENGYALGFS